MNILVVEDEPAIARPLVRALESSGFQARHAATLLAAREALVEAEPDLMVLDVGLPESEDGGFTLAREARQAGYRGPVLFLTARDALADRVRGLDEGGDDYVVKPFDLPELLARVRALLRRASEARSSRLSFGPLTIDLTNNSVFWEGRRVELSAREFALLERLALSPNRVFSPEELLDLVWGGEASGLGVVKVTVHHLRARLSPEVVRTERRGYILGLEPARP
ncbi:MAG TPA: response regulator transcription factor [Deinococcales bacterium]|nr:response regulator transcription factor [Deinococcales bacterium]